VELSKRSPEHKTTPVRSMFESIAPRYDFLNHFLSFGIDFYWRRQAIGLLKSFHPRRILDIATGTGDLAIAALKLEPAEVVGVDVAEEMMKLGREKLTRKGLDGVIKLQLANAERLPFPDGSFDAVTVAFGVRNFENLEVGLSEMHRVLKPEGVTVILEFSRPTIFFIKQVYGFYLERIVPRLGGLISHHRDAYEHLRTSVQGFPDGGDFLELLKKSGFSSVDQHRLTFGIASAYLGRK
jgi:demethylmenaquinone methyltransferase/2-methoxy-6-polyprenyl-1,4-benzoquinol methylase